MNNAEKSIIENQETLFTRIKRIHQLFKIHFYSLILLCIFALMNTILLSYAIITGQITPSLVIRYGLFGSIVTIIQLMLLLLIITQINIQIFFYRRFISEGDQSIQKSKEARKSSDDRYYDIVPYINNFYAFFNRFSKNKRTIIQTVTIFLFFNFMTGFYLMILISNLLGSKSINLIMQPWISIFFLGFIVSWFLNLITSFKIRNELKKWEQLFPKLDQWAQELEQLNSENNFKQNTKEDTK